MSGQEPLSSHQLLDKLAVTYRLKREEEDRCRKAITALEACGPNSLDVCILQYFPNITVLPYSIGDSLGLGEAAWKPRMGGRMDSCQKRPFEDVLYSSPSWFHFSWSFLARC